MKSSYDEIPIDSKLCEICRSLYLGDWIVGGESFFNETIAHLRERFDNQRCSGHCRLVLDAIEGCTDGHENGLIDSIELQIGEFGLLSVTCCYDGYGQSGRTIDITFYVPRPGKGSRALSIDMADP
jgi:hypothetical protein